MTRSCAAVLALAVASWVAGAALVYAVWQVTE